MSVIYEPKGKAGEYSPLACNLYKGCDHRCVYCYAPAATFTTRDNFSISKPRKDILRNLQIEAQKFNSHRKDMVLLCFTCDPYQKINEEFQLTRAALEILLENNFPVQILTKGGLRAVQDFDLLKIDPRNAFAVTLTHDKKAISRVWEPGAADPDDRIESLRLAYQEGISTWVSFEPVFDPKAVYRMIEVTHEFVDLYKIGKMNYHPIAKKIDWKAFKNKTVELLNHYGKEYYIKKDLDIF